MSAMTAAGKYNSDLANESATQPRCPASPPGGRQRNGSEAGEQELLLSSPSPFMNTMAAAAGAKIRCLCQAISHWTCQSNAAHRSSKRTGENQMKYEKIEPISREEAEAIICNGDPEAIGLTLIRLAYHHRDWRWVQDLCIGLSEHEDKWVRRNCATCFGHLARIHRKIDLEKVNPVLRRLLNDADAHGWAEDTVEDFKVFLK